MKIFWIILLVCLPAYTSSCRKTLHNTYSARYENNSYSLSFDTLSKTFSYLAEHPYGNTSIFGTYITYKSRIFLSPYQGWYFRQDSIRDSLITIRVFYGDDYMSVPNFVIRPMLEKQGAVILDSALTDLCSNVEKRLVISALGAYPFLFQHSGPGVYNVYLNSSNYNSDLFEYRIRKGKLVSNNGWIYDAEK